MAHDEGAPRKRSILLTPVGIGSMALLGTGTFAATNGFGLANRPCTTQHIATSLLQCQAIAPAATCAAAFAAGPGAVGLSRIGSGGTWRAEPLRVVSDGVYQTLAMAAFQPRTCPARSSSSSSSSRSGFYWGGGSSSSSSTSSASQSSVSRGGFGTTASSFSSRGS